MNMLTAITEAHGPQEHVVSDTEECWCQPTIVKVTNAGHVEESGSDDDLDLG